ncbi:unnamed protein product [Effrenium voratum]|uniref:Uncharacterized protein n=1 Tax=Effrenium voratum TaxID=2562239 RepID=A0AA36N9P0_9DINO|nr:unnamed protein product [Effrenium voratum]
MKFPPEDGLCLCVQRQSLRRIGRPCAPPTVDVRFAAAAAVHPICPGRWSQAALKLPLLAATSLLDFIDMYCFEYPINLRYSRGVLNNISIKEYTQPLRRCGCALVCKLCCQQAGNLEFGVLCRQKPERSKNRACSSAGATARACGCPCPRFFTSRTSCCKPPRACCSGTRASGQSGAAMVFHAEAGRRVCGVLRLKFQDGSRKAPTQGYHGSGQRLCQRLPCQAATSTAAAGCRPSGPKGPLKANPNRYRYNSV